MHIISKKVTPMIKHSILIGLLLSILFLAENHAMDKKCVPALFFDAARFGESTKVLELLPDASRQDISAAFKLSAGGLSLKTFELLFSSLKQLVSEPTAFQEVLNSSLYVACRYGGHPEIIVRLIKAGADIHCKKTEAIEMAIKHCNPDAIKILLAAGAQPDYFAKPVLKGWQADIDAIITEFKKDKPMLIIGKGS